ncbi:hypothetical protein AX15_003947 [Amanita polypyramis BW_CC]|nr:hypothetical protein AX15_003947 [Amanita polypyramis BW_CC]
MDYFSKFLRSSNQAPSPKGPVDHAQEFHKSWTSIKNALQHPDERQLSKGIKSTEVPVQLQSMVDALVWELTRTEAGGTGACLEYLLKNDVLDSLVRLSENDRPFGIQAEVLRTVQNMVVLLDEQFLIHSAVHRAVLRLLKNCIGDDLQEQLDGRNRVMGAARNASRSQPSEYEGDLVNLLCILCSRIKTFRELLMIFFHDKHWYRSEPLFSVEEEDDDDDEYEVTVPEAKNNSAVDSAAASDSGSITPTSSRATVTSAPVSSVARKPEYEFLLFNYLLRFVHREGHVGDFARAGLLFLMDVAMSPGDHHMTNDEPHGVTSGAHGTAVPPMDPISDAALALAEYILDGDFSDVLGAGLSAVYSLLPRKLEFLLHSNGEYGHGTGMRLGQGGPETEEEKERREAARQRALALGVEEANSDDFRSRLDHFLKLLEFVQDICKRNIAHEPTDPWLVGSAIVQSILDGVRRVFLENVLYPSILECSDADGSAVAVMSYIETVIRTLPDGQLNDLLVDFLVSEDNDDVREGQGHISKMNFQGSEKRVAAAPRLDKSRKRKSSAMVLLEMEAPESRRKSEYFTSMGRFTLKDLILTNLRSQSELAPTCALQLLQIMLLRHPQLSMDKLLLVTHDSNATSFPIPSMVTVSSGSESDERRYFEDDPYVGGPRAVFEGPLFTQPETTFTTHEREIELYLTLVSRVDPSHEDDVFSTGYDRYLRDAILSIQSQPAYLLTGDDEADLEFRRKTRHRLNVNDPVLTLLLESLRAFFSNTPDHNLALTEALATLAMHPDRSLAGWLTFGASDLPTFQAFRPERASSPKQDDDNCSIDYEIGERLYNDELHLPASRMDENSRPVIHTIIHGLVTQLDKYRQMVDDFDKYLLERRQGLLFSESLTDALNLALDIGEGPSATPPPTGTPSRSKSKPVISASTSLVSFLSPRKNRVAKSSDTNMPSKHAESKNMSASPFGDHYQSTNSVLLEPFMAPTPSSGPWTPRKTTKWSADEEDVFNSSGWSERSEEFFSLREERSRETKTHEKHTTTVTLSLLLDNVVILEESIKELVSIIHARRCLGIDSIRYL